MRKYLLLFCLTGLVLTLLVGCSDDTNLKPLITRIEASIECSPPPVDIQFVAYVTGGDPLADPTGANALLNLDWDFQDGESGSGSIVTHRFTLPGLYNVVATVTDDDGDTDRDSILIEVRADSLFVVANNDTTVTASMAYFDVPTIGTSNGSGGTNIRPSVLFNEVLAFNESIIQNPVNNQYEPVLELYNPTAGSVSLNGWSLSNDVSNPGLWDMPTDTELASGEFLMIWVDNRDGAGVYHTNFHMTGNWEGEPEDFVGSIYLYDSQQVLVDQVQLLIQHADKSFGHLPDASDDGLVILSVDADLCGFDPVDGLYERFNVTWDMDDSLGSVYPLRRPLHVFNTEDVGEREVIVTVYDTHTSVTRLDTMLVEVLLPTP
jgi:hypothetical protein